MTTPEPSYREIPLTKGQVALVDTEDYDWLMKWKWTAMKGGGSGGFYAVRNLRREERAARGSNHRICIPMHRQILGLAYGDSRESDHINGNKLDNRRFNLRITTHAKNGRNLPKNRNNTSGYKGVFLIKETGRWRAAITLNRRAIHLGVFANPQDAHAAYCAAAKELHEEFARLK